MAEIADQAVGDIHGARGMAAEHRGQRHARLRVQVAVDEVPAALPRLDLAEPQARPSAASPMVPETKIASPGRAPARVTMRPLGMRPSAVTDTVTPPEARMVSPPRRVTP